ncbi:hypothetical protein U9P67_11415 [Escherichia coli]|uniref:hypothetical protein n=1 Tax=Enterobacter sp. GM-22 TaxID=3110787 RepID=UPI002B0AA5CA|nr:hypothetical protein [Enterobacter sp. GM-22]MEA3563247.1 hypothetical protein [Enterobacter sp. GM-22]
MAKNLSQTKIILHRTRLRFLDQKKFISFIFLQTRPLDSASAGSFTETQNSKD